MTRHIVATGCVAIGAALFAASATAQTPATDAGDRKGGMHGVAEGYVRLVLALGQHDADYVDAYYGPPEWKTEADAAKVPLDQLGERAKRLTEALGKVPAPAGELEQLRAKYLERQIAAAAARIRMLQGERLTFDQESQALYDAVAPTLPESHFQAILDQLDKAIPGKGPLVGRYEAFRREFVVPPDRLDTVFQAAIRGCRERTLRHISLPEGERFTLEYVTDKSWSGYNWYQGNYRSLIQMNTDLPVYIDRALDLACHEGYPGHHVYNVLLEKHLVRDRGWVEFSVFALFSPQALIAEGTANYGIDVAFPGPERLAFERTVLFPAAGIDSARADDYYRVQAMVEKLAYAGNEAARRYLNGAVDRDAAADWLERYALMSRERAQQRVRFFDQYRSYVINYNLGKDLVRQFIESRPGVADSEQRRWQEFEKLLSSPRLPSTLK
jgi:hypothetical protein